MLAYHPTRSFVVLLLKTCCGPSDQGGTGGSFFAGSIEPLIKVGANRVGEQADKAILTVTVAAEMADVDKQFVAALHRVRSIDEYDTRILCRQGSGDVVGWAWIRHGRFPLPLVRRAPAPRRGGLDPEN